MMKDDQISIRLPGEVRVQLEKIAAAEDRSLSATVRRIVVLALKHRGADQLASRRDFA
jgi:hypothetical protein